MSSEKHTAEQQARLENYKKLLQPIGEAPARAPDWIIPGLIQPGLMFLVGAARTYKSTLALHIAAAITRGIEVDPAHQAPKLRGSVIYFPAEQSAGRLRHIYETRVLGYKITDPTINWDFTIARNPWDWKLDEPKPGFNLLELVTDLNPTLLILDPLIHFHHCDENDPHIVGHIVPLKQAMAQRNGCILLIHHARKNRRMQKATDDDEDWDMMRGSSAMWAAADGGIMVRRMKTGGGITLRTDFKDHPGSIWTWRPK